MGRLVIARVAFFFGRPRSMYLALTWCLVCSTLSTRSTTAADIDNLIYPEFPDGDILQRIQHLLSEIRQQRRFQLQQTGPESEMMPMPEFTYHFPEHPNTKYQSDLFAVPPSDPRYYHPDIEDGDPTEPRNFVEKKVKPDTPSESMSSPESGSDKEVMPRAGDPESPGEREEEVPDVRHADDETAKPNNVTPSGHQDVVEVLKKLINQDGRDQEFLLISIMAACGAAALAGFVVLIYGWYRLHNNSKAAADVEYPAYGVTGPNKEITPTGDRRLAQSAQMYHYQHQKQQIIAMENNRVNNERRGSVSEGDSDEENEEGDYTVYECPGLAATGELEVRNPLFQDDPTPAAANHTSDAPPILVEDNK